MDAWTMWLVALAVVVLPFVLMAVFRGADIADSRGRRVSRAWRVRGGHRRRRF